MTDPLPHRVIRNIEEPVKFSDEKPVHAGAGAFHRPFINWGTTHWNTNGGHDSGEINGSCNGQCLDVGHQADDGAGTRVNLEQQNFSPVLLAAFQGTTTTTTLREEVRDSGVSRS